MKTLVFQSTMNRSHSASETISTLANFVPIIFVPPKSPRCLYRGIWPKGSSIPLYRSQMYTRSHVLRPDEIPKVTYYCPKKEGAVSSLPIQAKTENTVASTDFGKWMIRHIDHWFAWARQLGLEVDRMEDIVLVTGTHCTRSCTNVAFPGGLDDAQISFGAKVDHSDDGISINWQFSHEQNRGVVLNYGPEGKV